MKQGGEYLVETTEKVQGTEKEFMDIFKTLCYSRSSWEVWADLMTVISCSISNAIDRSPEHYEKREREYESCIKRIGSVETASKIMTVIVMALERNPDQDFLGKMYMNLELGNHWKGQFFTPYSVCRMMAEINIGPGVQEEIERKGYIAVNDPSCGAGATLIAAANTFKRNNIDYQNRIVFVGQDIDRVVGMMCYIQLSLLGCAGYIAIANTLTNPLCGTILAPTEKEGQELWYMPMFATQQWSIRRLMCSLGLHRGTETTKKTVEKEHFYMFFDFNDKEANYGEQRIAE